MFVYAQFWLEALSRIADSNHGLQILIGLSHSKKEKIALKSGHQQVSQIGLTLSINIHIHANDS